MNIYREKGFVGTRKWSKDQGWVISMRRRTCWCDGVLYWFLEEKSQKLRCFEMETHIILSWSNKWYSIKNLENIISSEFGINYEFYLSQIMQIIYI